MATECSSGEQAFGGAYVLLAVFFTISIFHEFIMLIHRYRTTKEHKLSPPPKALFYVTLVFLTVSLAALVKCIVYGLTHCEQVTLSAAFANTLFTVVFQDLYIVQLSLLWIILLLRLWFAFQHTLYALSKFVLHIYVVVIATFAIAFTISFSVASWYELAVVVSFSASIFVTLSIVIVHFFKLVQIYKYYPHFRETAHDRQYTTQHNLDLLSVITKISILALIASCFTFVVLLILIFVRVFAAYNVRIAYQQQLLDLCVLFDTYVTAICVVFQFKYHHAKYRFFCGFLESRCKFYCNKYINNAPHIPPAQGSVLLSAPDGQGGRVVSSSAGLMPLNAPSPAVRPASTSTAIGGGSKQRIASDTENDDEEYYNEMGRDDVLHLDGVPEEKQMEMVTIDVMDGAVGPLGTMSPSRIKQALFANVNRVHIEHVLMQQHKFTRPYIQRAMNVYEKHYGTSVYDIEIVEEILYRLTVKDHLVTLKRVQNLYHSRDSVREVLRTLNFGARYINLSLLLYEVMADMLEIDKVRGDANIYDLEMITEMIMRLRAKFTYLGYLKSDTDRFGDGTEDGTQRQKKTKKKKKKSKVAIGQKQRSASPDGIRVHTQQQQPQQRAYIDDAPMGGLHAQQTVVSIDAESLPSTHAGDHGRSPEQQQQQQQRHHGVQASADTLDALYENVQLEVEYTTDMNKSQGELDVGVDKVVRSKFMHVNAQGNFSMEFDGIAIDAAQLGGPAMNLLTPHQHQAMENHGTNGTHEVSYDTNDNHASYDEENEPATTRHLHVQNGAAPRHPHPQTGARVHGNGMSPSESVPDQLPQYGSHYKPRESILSRITAQEEAESVEIDRSPRTSAADVDPPHGHRQTLSDNLAIAARQLYSIDEQRADVEYEEKKNDEEEEQGEHVDSTSSSSDDDDDATTVTTEPADAMFESMMATQLQHAQAQHLPPPPCKQQTPDQEHEHGQDISGIVYEIDATSPGSRTKTFPTLPASQEMAAAKKARFLMAQNNDEFGHITPLSEQDATQIVINESELASSEDSGDDDTKQQQQTATATDNSSGGSGSEEGSSEPDEEEESYDEYDLSPDTTIASPAKEKNHEIASLFSSNYAGKHHSFTAAMSALRISDHAMQETLTAMKTVRMEQELLETEQRYIEGLRVLLEQFIIPIFSQKMIPSQYQKQVTCNIPELISFHTRFLKSLRHSSVAHAFHANAANFQMYSVYIGEYSNILDIFAKCKKNKKLQSFLRSKQRMEQKNLSSYLILPLQRIAYYLSLLRELSQKMNSPSSSASTLEIQAIEKVTRQIAAVSEPLHEKQAAIENVTMALSMANKLRGLNINIVESTRTFVAHFIFECRLNREHKQFFVFTDVVIVSDMQWRTEQVVRLSKFEAKLTAAKEQEILLIRIIQRHNRKSSNLNEVQGKSEHVNVFEANKQIPFVSAAKIAEISAKDGHENISNVRLFCEYIETCKQQIYHGNGNANGASAAAATRLTALQSRFTESTQHSQSVDSDIVQMVTQHQTPPKVKSAGANYAE